MTSHTTPLEDLVAHTRAITEELLATELPNVHVRVDLEDLERRLRVVSMPRRPLSSAFIRGLRPIPKRKEKPMPTISAQSLANKQPNYPFNPTAPNSDPSAASNVSSSDPVGGAQASYEGCSFGDLMVWLRQRTHTMWNDIGDMTTGVNERQAAMDALTALKAAKTNQDSYNACVDAMKHLPPGSAEYQKVKELADVYENRMNAVNEGNKQGKSDADVVAQIGDFNSVKEAQKETIDQLKSDLNLENSQATVLVQKAMNDVGEVMAEVSAIIKQAHDTSMSAINKIG